MGTLPNMAVMGRTKRRGVGASSYSLQVSAFLIQSSGSGSGAPYCSSLDKRAHFMLTVPISSHNNGEEEQAFAVPHVVKSGMKQGVIGSQWSDKHKVLAVAIAPKGPLWDLPHAFMRLLPVGFHMGAQGIHLVIIAMSIECKHQVCVIGLLTR